MRPGQRCARIARHKGGHDYDPVFGRDWHSHFGYKSVRCGYVEPKRTKPDPRPMLGLELTSSLEQDIVNAVTGLLRVLRGPRISAAKDSS